MIKSIMPVEVWDGGGEGRGEYVDKAYEWVASLWSKA